MVKQYRVQGIQKGFRRRSGRLKKAVSAFVTAALLSGPMIPALTVSAGVSSDIPVDVSVEPIANVYIGRENAYEVLNNISFNDLTDAWSRDAVYEAGALDIVKGFGSAAFGRTTVMTKTQALAMVFRAAGMEAEMQTIGEDHERAARATGAPASSADTIWLNGSLQLALDMGMITETEYAAAMGDSAAQARTTFRRNGEALRQEFAYWMAIALEIAPVRGQQAIFNSYSDWRQADPLFIPYIEAILAEQIMSGRSDGTFGALEGITREQAAQVTVNASRFVYVKNGLTETIGVIERIDISDRSGSIGAHSNLDSTMIYVRNAQGRLDTIDLNLISGQAVVRELTTDLVVNADGELWDSTVLQQGDRIRYITKTGGEATGKPDAVQYVAVLSHAISDSYVLAQIDRVDTENHKISLTQFFPIMFTAAGEVKKMSSSVAALNRLSAEYVYSANVTVIVDGTYVTPAELKVGMNVIVGLMQYRQIFRVETTGIGYNLGEAGVLKGIVEENNPVLGYLALYNELGASSSGMKSPLRIYNYTNPTSLDIRRNGEAVSIDEILPGDSAYLKVDDDEEITAVSAVDNYKRRYGKIAALSGNSMAVAMEDGKMQSFTLNGDVLYFQDYILVGRNALVVGMGVRLLIHDSGTVQTVKEVKIDSPERMLISNVYKAVLSYIDMTSEKAVVYNVQRLHKGVWERSDKKGFDTFPITRETVIYLNNTKFTPEKASKMLRDNEVYIAVGREFGKEEKAAVLNVRNFDDHELLYDDYIKGARATGGTFGLIQGPADIRTYDGTIVIKDGRLVPSSNIAYDDQVYLVANREDATGRYRADVVQIADRISVARPSIYRGRITAVKHNVSFTIESFSELHDTAWQFANTPKTFEITYDTVLLSEAGIESIRNFDSRGVYNYLGRTVYIAAEGNDALAISTAPYGIYQFRGEIERLDGFSYGDDGAVMDGPTAFALMAASRYDQIKKAWIGTSDMNIALGGNSLLFKNGYLIEASALERGDRVRVVKREDSPGGIGYILIVEN